MNRQEKLDKTYMRMTLEWAKQSHCVKKQVGALIVKDNRIISDGYNGTPSGFDNKCEFLEAIPGIEGAAEMKTKWEVLHAEANAILKCAKYGSSCNGATLYLSMATCKDCSKLIHQSGIERVVYLEEYRDKKGIYFLESANVKVEKIEL